MIKNAAKAWSGTRSVIFSAYTALNIACPTCLYLMFICSHEYKFNRLALFRKKKSGYL